MNNRSNELIRILSKLAEQAYSEGWFSLEYLTYDDPPAFLSDSQRATADALIRIPIFAQGLEQLLSSPDTAGLDHFLDESITGNDDTEELLVSEFLRSVALRMNGTETESRLMQIIKR